MNEDGTISIFIDAHGNARLKTSGAPGSKCIELSKEVEAMLGTQKDTLEYTSEFYDKEKERAVIIRQGGGR